MPTLTSLTVELRGDSSSLVRASRSGLRALQGITHAAGRLTLATGALGATALTAGAAGLVALGNAARSSIDAHAKMAARLGITVAEAQKLGIAARQADVETRTLNTAFATLNRELGKAITRGGASAEKFERLGLSVAELQNLSSFERFQAVIGALGQVEDQALRGALANDVLGQSYVKLNPLIASGAAAFSNAEAIVDRLGLGLGEGAKETEELNDAFDSLLALGTSLRDKVFAALVPRLAEFAKGAFRVATAFVEANGGGAQLAETISKLLIGGLRGVVETTREFGQVLAAVFKGAKFLINVVQAIGQFGAGAAAYFASIFRGDFAGARAINSSLAGDVADRFGGDTESEALEESRRQTDLLRELARKEFGAAFG